MAENNNDEKNASKKRPRLTHKQYAQVNHWMQKHRMELNGMTAGEIVDEIRGDLGLRVSTMWVGKRRAGLGIHTARGPSTIDAANIRPVPWDETVKQDENKDTEPEPEPEQISKAEPSDEQIRILAKYVLKLHFAAELDPPRDLIEMCL